MGDYKRLALLVLIMIGVCLIVGATAIGVIYNAALDRERARLVNIAQSQARLMEALAGLEAPTPTEGEQPSAGALSQILEAHRLLREQGIGQTAEVQLAHRDGDFIVFVTPARGSDLPHDPVAFGGPAAEPMTAALTGRSGTTIGRDYAGRRVLAAFEPVPHFGLGLVAKIDMAEINGRYLRAGAIAALVSLAAVLGAALLFFRVGEPMVRRLRESEERYRNLVEAQPDPICQFLPDTTLTFVNRAYADFYGREPEELIGRRWLDFAPTDERPRFLDELAFFTPANPERHEETRSTRADREVRWYLCHLYGFFDDAGNILSFQTFGTDITERKRAEEQLAQQLGLLTAITDSAADAIFVTDGAERVTVMNPAAERIFGWSREELAARKLHDAIHDRHPDGRPYLASECPLSRVYTTGETLLGHEDVFFHKDGSPVPVACSNAPLMIEGRISGAVLLAHDITNRKRAEQALRESEARYRTAGEAIRYGVWVCNPEGGVEFVSQIFLDLIGKTLDEVKPRGWLDRLPPEDLKPTLQAWRVYQIQSATFDSGVLDNQELDELARLKRGGIVIGLTLSGADQAEVLRRARTIERNGEPLFGCVQATWNLLEPSAGPALAEARAAGMGIIVKALANGRLTSRKCGRPGEGGTLRQEAERLGVGMDALALAAAMAQPWADVALSGAVTIEQLQSNLLALDIVLDREAIGALEGLAEDPASYWQTRSRLKWN